MHVVENAIAKIARRQDNVITREQLLSVGLGRGAIEHRVKGGTMQRIHKSVFLIGPAPPTPMARARAAALACGDGAVVSHRTAAELYGLLPKTAGDVDVTVAARNPGARPGIRLHRVAGIGPGEAVSMRGMAITSAARTICDIAATELSREVEHALQEALYREVITEASVADVIAREPHRRGAPVIRALLDDTSLTRSERERTLLRLIKAAHLPKPVTNVRVHGYLVDALWPSHGLVLEFDGWGAHGHRLAFERDRKRDQILVAAGFRVIRVTDHQLKNEPIAVAARIAQALRDPLPTGGWTRAAVD